MYERLGLVRLGGDGAGVSIGMWDEICDRDDRISESVSNLVHPVNPVQTPGAA